MSEGSEAIVFTGKVDEKGHVKPDEVNRTRGRLARWKGRRVTVTVKRYVKPKTLPQLGWYFAEGWGILDCWADYIGDDREAVHRDLKDAFLVPILVTAGKLPRISKVTGEIVNDTPSLSDLTSEEMSKYIDRVLREGAQRGIVFEKMGEA